MATAQQVYSSEVALLPPSEQLRLATLILAGLPDSAASALDFSDHWSAEDVRDLTAYALEHASRSIGED